MMWENERMHAVLGLSAGDEPVSGSRFADEFVCAENAPEAAP